MFIRSFLFRHGPTPGSLLDSRGQGFIGYITLPFIRAYSSWWEYSKTMLIAWHRQELKEIDFRFAHQDAVRELIHAREAARARGVKPLDPAYPDIEDFLPRKRLRR